MNRSRNIFTCGCNGEAIDESRLVRIKSIDRTGEHCIDAICVCETCAIWYRKNNLIIDHEEQAERWLSSNKSAEEIDIE